MRTAYSPAHDGDPDPGEIVWTWVPYEENDGRGKDRSGRASWVDVDRVPRLHEAGMRREACALDRMRFDCAMPRRHALTAPPPWVP